MSFIYIGAILLVVKFWHCNQTPVLGKCLRLSFVKIHQLHLLLGPFIALHQRLTTGPTGRRVKIIEKFTGTMGNNGGKQETQPKKKKNDAFCLVESPYGVYILYCFSFRKPISHIPCRGFIFSYGKHGTWESPFWRCK